MKTLATVISVAGLCVGMTLAQPETVGKGRPADRVAAKDQPATRESEEKKPSVSIKFAGGTIAEYFKQLRKAAAPQPVNVVASKEILETTIPEIWLEDVSMDTAVFAVQSAAPGGTNWNAVKDFGQMYRLQTRVQARPTVAVAISMNGVIQSQPGDPAEAKITLPVESVLSSIEQLIEVSKSESPAPPKVTFHRESGLLMVSGEDRTVESIQSLIRTLENDVRQRRGQLQSPFAGLMQEAAVQYVMRGAARTATLSRLSMLATNEGLGKVLKVVQEQNKPEADATTVTVSGPALLVAALDLGLGWPDDVKPGDIQRAHGGFLRLGGNKPAEKPAASNEKK